MATDIIYFSYFWHSVLYFIKATGMDPGVPVANKPKITESIARVLNVLFFRNCKQEQRLLVIHNWSRIDYDMDRFFILFAVRPE